jgi:hypothetical protein
MNTEPTRETGASSLFLCKLSLERSRMYLAHLCACVHLGGGHEYMLDIIEGLERELHVSTMLLDPAA